MFTRLSKMLPATAIVATLSTAAFAEVGVMNFTFDAPHRDRLVQALVWYPAEGGGMNELTGENVVFRGTQARRDAKPDHRKHPLIVLSHGSGGNAASLSWLSSALADAGYVVIAPNHQGSTSGDSTPETTIPATWLRKYDMTSLLDAIAASPAITSMVDAENLTAIGFSLGGQTVLGLVGAELRAKALADDCKSEHGGPGCSWLKQGNGAIKGHVDFDRIDAAKFNARYIEPRVKNVIAIDPAFVPAYDLQSIKAIKVPVSFINLGLKEEVASGVDASPFVSQLPSAGYERVKGANHFSFLAECKTLGWLWIMLEGDDPVCSSSGARDRAVIHAEIADMIIGLLKRARTKEIN